MSALTRRREVGDHRGLEFPRDSWTREASGAPKSPLHCQHLSPWQQQLKEEMARVTQEEEAFPVGRTPSSSSSPSYTYFHSLLINRFYIYPHCSPNQTSFSLALSHAELWHAAIHAVPFPIINRCFAPFSFSLSLPCGWHSSSSKAAETPLLVLHAWAAFDLKKKNKLVLQSNDLIARTTIAQRLSVTAWPKFLQGSPR